MSKNYNSKSIEEKTDIEHIRLRPGMYIGSVDDPRKLFDEIFDNSLDEAQNNFCKEITIKSNDKSIQVDDDGRGIPVKDGTLEKITNKLFTSGKFNDSSYSIAAGLHGVGMTVVNALSKSMKIDSIDSDGYIGELEYKNGQIIKNTEKQKSTPASTRTSIYFEPDEKIFRSTVIPNKYITERIRLSSALLPKTKFVLNDKEVKFSLEQYIKDELDITNNDIEMYNIKVKKGPEHINVFFVFDDSITSKGSINIKPCNQGTHINFIRDAICNKIIETDKTLEIKDVYNLKLYVDGKLKDTNYTGQTKERLDTDKKYLVNKFTEEFTDQLNVMIKTNEGWWDGIIDSLNSHKQFILSKKNISTAVAGTRSKYVNVEGLRDCSVFDEHSELFIVEGKSAAGSIISCRDSKRHAIIALKGKVLNVETADFDKFMQNKELKNLFTAFGTGIKTDKTVEDISKLRYGKICLSSDADPDGSHITCLMITAIMKFTPSLVAAGRVYIVDMPLYGYTHKNVFHPVYNLDDAKELRKTHHMTRFKGLGEFDPSEMYEVALNPKSRNLIQLRLTDKVDEVIKMMSDANRKKQLLQMRNLIDENL